VDLSPFAEETEDFGRKVHSDSVTLVGFCSSGLAIFPATQPKLYGTLDCILTGVSLLALVLRMVLALM
jgi:hypothetical protein